jgi:glucose-1-phosphate cytidylyltransferase
MLDNLAIVFVGSEAYQMIVTEAVILAGGLGTRLKEETNSKPKPMVTVGPNPILIEIISHFVKYGCDTIIICGGYKVEFIREYFKESKNTKHHETFENTDIFSINIDDTRIKVKLVDTGIETPTGGRIKIIEKEITSQSFFCTYGDGLSNVDLHKVVELHSAVNDIATLTAVKPPSRFGVLEVNDSGKVFEFLEKPKNTWVNGGFFLFNKEIFKFLDENSILETEVLPFMAKQLRLSAYKHEGFWYSMDTLRDYEYLNELALETPPPWK